VNTLSYKTISAKKETVEKNWFVVDVSEKTLGRVSSDIAKIIRGKHKPSFTPHVDCGDNVIVINCDNIKLTGKKWTDKVYLSHSGFPGGQKSITPLELKRKSSAKLIEKAVRGMLPKTKLGDQLIKNLFAYETAEHPHEAQQPKELKL